jgi:rare lipoprotein A
MRSIVFALTVALPLLAAAELSVARPELLSEFEAVADAKLETKLGIEGDASADADADSQALEVVATSQGLASFYAKRFHGRPTASGEPHDATALTAAHRSLPFGTWVRVQSLHSGREVKVRINDRGPFARGRVIDLSRAAAQALGMLHAGTHAVEVHVLGLSKP